MHIYRQMVLVGACILGTLLLSSCNETTRPVLSEVVQTGKTDDPAPGYESIRAGSEEEFILQVGRRIYFAGGSGELDDTARETLDLAASWLNQNPAWLVKLQGFADDPGGDSANTALSDRRARAVMDHLASRGVDARRMWAKGYGIDRQVRDCSSISCKALNRRVVINLRTEFDDAAPQKKLAGG